MSNELIVNLTHLIGLWFNDRFKAVDTLLVAPATVAVIVAMPFIKNSFFATSLALSSSFLIYFF